MGRFKLAWAILKAKKDPQKVEANKESQRVLALKRQIKTLEEINQSLTDQVRSYAKQFKQQQNLNMEEKMLDMAMNLLAPKSNLNTHAVDAQATEAKPSQETNTHSKEDQIITFIENLPDNVKKASAKVSYESFASVAKAKQPNLTEEQIQFAHNYIQEKYG